ncbi:hypothetical protein BOTBODRAFT_53170 [Botryobasidium botryosum FD-172 SS1]|uniref:Carboxypeptidase n=1 Tax=Botryobasidium botryosum (strain FD-172 SS1) TaxID=930990 RepID=A0A067MPU7_BOTB1|nr:hypothetical protein BOTBODRAFT_53170 [Botryobasidium botryosum FD-172 SS1]
MVHVVNGWYINRSRRYQNFPSKQPKRSAMLSAIIIYALCFTFVLEAGASRSPHRREKQAARRKEHSSAPRPRTTLPEIDHTKRAEPISFANDATKAFYVNGKNIPTVPFDVGDSWAGLLPVGPSANETRKLYFWYFPTAKDVGKDDFIIWLNGGPGCSSLEGFLQENGPISFQYGQYHASQNPYSWTNVSNMLWVDQPVGTGFSQGTPDAKNEVDVANHFIGFLEQCASPGFIGYFTKSHIIRSKSSRSSLN